MTGTVENGRIYDNDEHGTVFWLRLDGGQRFYYMDGDSEYRRITQLAKPGANVKIWPWTNHDISSLAQLDVEGDRVLSYEQAAQDHRDRARESRIAGGVCAVLALLLTGTLTIVLARTPQRPVAQPLRTTR